MFSWNDFLYPLVFINSDAMKTLALGLMDLMSQSQFTGVFDWGLSMSATALALIPCFIHLIAQRYFIQGITQVYTARLGVICCGMGCESYLRCSGSVVSTACEVGMVLLRTTGNAGGRPTIRR